MWWILAWRSVTTIQSTLYKNTIQAIDHIHAFIGEKGFISKVHNWFCAFKEKVEKFFVKLKTSMRYLILYFDCKYSSVGSPKRIYFYVSIDQALIFVIWYVYCIVMEYVQVQVKSCTHHSIMIRTDNPIRVHTMMVTSIYEFS